MSSLFSESATNTIKSIKKFFLWTAVCILIGEVVTGAILIIAQAFDLTIGKLMATFALCGLVLFVGVNNFSRMEKDGILVQSFALASLIANLVWLTIAILFIWEIIPAVESTSTSFATAMVKVLSVSVEIATMCFLISNVWSIEETVKPVKPLKITALICELYCGIYGIVVILGNFQVSDPRWPALAGLAGLAFILMACAAAIVSNSGKKKNDGRLNVKDKEVQTTIQEMVEKEVQQRLQAEKEKAEREAMPPLQSDDMAPEVKRDGELEIKPEGQTIIEAEKQSGVGVQPSGEAEPQLENQSGAESQPVVQSGAETESQPEVQPGAEAESQPENQPENQPEA